MSDLLGGAAPSPATKTARIAAIKAVLLNSTYLKTASGGDKYVAANELVKYLRAQMVAIATTDAVPSERQAAVAAVGARIEIVPKIGPWSTLVSRDNWKANPSWPAVAELSNAEKTAGFIKVVDGLKATSNRITEHYEYLKTNLITTIPQAYDEVAAAYDMLPEVTQRNADTRSYIYTYVDDWGWESAVSPPSDVVTVDENDLVKVTVTAPPASRNIKRVRLYRSASGSSAAAFQFVMETPSDMTDGTWPTLTNRQFDDTKKVAELQEVCPTMLWIEPPADLKGIKAMPNGVIIGFDGNNLFFCEPFKPYAWPKEYRLTTEHKIVGIGVFGQTAVVLTEGFPYYVTGADSSTMSAQKLEFPQACVSKRTIASVDGGVVFASPDGLCLASAGGVVNLLQGVVDRTAWRGFVGDGTGSFGAYHEGIYYIFNVLGIGFAVDVASRKLSRLSRLSTGVYSDLLTDKLYVVDGTSLIDLFGGATMNTAVWKSRPFVISGHTGFSCLRVESAFEAAVTVKVYGDGVLRHTATFTTREPQRLPPGRYREFEIQIEAACPVTRVTMATSMQELAKV